MLYPLMTFNKPNCSPKPCVPTPAPGRRFPSLDWPLSQEEKRGDAGWFQLLGLIKLPSGYFNIAMEHGP